MAINSRAQEIAESLENHYEARINEPIIENKEDSPLGQPRLIFPSVREAFIPQSFRVLRYLDKSQHLEEDATWKLSRRNDLGAFLFSYLSSPHSTETPLIILGHPGSGKSLLTKMLAARVMSKHYTAIRVPLREVNADSEIISQIEESLRQTTDFASNTWISLIREFKNNPPLIILDGYDELLQASGKVFSSYLKKVQQFQEAQTEKKRPVRVIVTSRITLIDKAEMPLGTTILRLSEFDKRQRDTWIAIWNRANSNYFREANVQEFSLTDETGKDATKIQALAEQPLLLLMLALYDSENNELRNSHSLDRTRLYDSLLRRFVDRERIKDSSFRDAEKSFKKNEIDKEMKRLGVAAIGMYNRRKVHILTPELNDDLKFFDLERTLPDTSGRALSQADLLLGSFFFVHKSKAQQTAGAADHHEESAAFEFLHNTFGEFLSADFILRWTYSEVSALKALHENEALGETLVNRLNSADGFQQKWLACLVYTPLFTRPVVLEMMQEWIRHIVCDKRLPRQDFLKYLDIIILNQIKRLLDKKEMPSIIRGASAQEQSLIPFSDYPLLGHIAIYSINLILLRLIVGQESFVFAENQITSHEDGTRPWDRLTHIWRSWFSLENLNGVSAIMVAERKDSIITIQLRDKFQVSESHDRLRMFYNVAVAIGDNTASGIAGLLLFDPYREDSTALNDIVSRLNSENIDLELQISMQRVFNYEGQLRHGNEVVEDFFESVAQALQICGHKENAEAFEFIALSLRRSIRWLTSDTYGCPRHQLLPSFRRSVKPDKVANLVGWQPSAALIFYQVAQELGDWRWIQEFKHICFRRELDRDSPWEFVMNRPEEVIPRLHLLKKIGFVGGSIRQIEFIEQLFRPKHIEKLLRQSPETTLTFIRVLRELNLGCRLNSKILSELLHTSLLEKLATDNPVAVFTLAQFIGEVGGNDSLKKIMSKSLKRTLSNPAYLQELIESNPKSALSGLRMMREIGIKYPFSDFNPRFLKNYFHPDRLFEIAEWDPELVMTLLQLAQELGINEFSQEFEFGLHKIFHTRQFLELLAWKPEVLLAWLQLAQDTGNSRLLSYFEDRGLEDEFLHSLHLNMLQLNPNSIVALLKLARHSNSRKFNGMLFKALRSELHDIHGGQSLLETLPISCIPDLEWLIEETGDLDIKSELKPMIGKTKDLMSKLFRI